MPMDTFTVSGSDLAFTGPAKANSRSKTTSGKKRGGGGGAKSSAQKTSNSRKSRSGGAQKKRSGRKSGQRRSTPQSTAGRKPQTTGGKKRSSRRGTTGSPQSQAQARTQTQRRRVQGGQRSQSTGLLGMLSPDPVFTGKRSLGSRAFGSKERRSTGVNQVHRLVGMLAMNFIGGYIKNKLVKAESTWGRALTDFALWFGAYRFLPTNPGSKAMSAQSWLAGLRMGAMDISAFSLANEAFAGVARVNGGQGTIANIGQGLQNLTGGGDGLISAGTGGQARPNNAANAVGEQRAQQAQALQDTLNSLLAANADLDFDPNTGLFVGTGSDEANAAIATFNSLFSQRQAQLSFDAGARQATVSGPLVKAAVSGDYGFLFSPQEVSAEIEKELTGLEGKKADYEVALGNVFGSLNGKQATVYEHLQFQLAQFAQALNLTRDYLAAGLEDNAADVLRQALQMDTVLQNAISAFLAGAEEAPAQAQAQPQAQVQMAQGQFVQQRPQGQVMPQGQVQMAQGQVMPQGQAVPQGQFAPQGQLPPMAPGQYAQSQTPLQAQIAQGQFVQPSGIPQIPQGQYAGQYAPQALPQGQAQQAGGYLGNAFVLTDHTVGDIMVPSPPVQQLVVQTTAGPAIDAFALLNWGANTAGHLNNSLGRHPYDQTAIDGADVATGWALDALQRGNYPVVHGGGVAGVVGGNSAYNGNIQVNGLGGNAQVGSASRQLNLLMDGNVFTVGGDAASVYRALSSLMDQVAAD